MTRVGGGRHGAATAVTRTRRGETQQALKAKKIQLARTTGRSIDDISEAELTRRGLGKRGGVTPPFDPSEPPVWAETWYKYGTKKPPVDTKSKEVSKLVEKEVERLQEEYGDEIVVNRENIEKKIEEGDFVGEEGQIEAEREFRETVHTQITNQAKKQVEDSETKEFRELAAQYDKNKPFMHDGKKYYGAAAARKVLQLKEVGKQVKTQNNIDVFSPLPQSVDPIRVMEEEKKYYQKLKDHEDNLKQLFVPTQLNNPIRKHSKNIIEDSIPGQSDYYEKNITSPFWRGFDNTREKIITGGAALIATAGLAREKITGKYTPYEQYVFKGTKQDRMAGALATPYNQLPENIQQKYDQQIINLKTKEVEFEKLIKSNPMYQTDVNYNKLGKFKVDTKNAIGQLKQNAQYDYMQHQEFREAQAGSYAMTSIISGAIAGYNLAAPSIKLGVAAKNFWMPGFTSAGKSLTIMGAGDIAGAYTVKKTGSPVAGVVVAAATMYGTSKAGTYVGNKFSQVGVVSHSLPGTGKVTAVGTKNAGPVITSFKTTKGGGIVVKKLGGITYVKGKGFGFVKSSKAVKPLKLNPGQEIDYTKYTASTPVKSSLKTQLILDAVKKSPEISKTELVKAVAPYQLSKKFYKQPSAYLRPYNLKEVQNIPKSLKQPIEQLLEKHSKNFLIKGSSVQPTQLSPDLMSKRLIEKDIDIAFYSPKARDVFRKEAVELAKKHGKVEFGKDYIKINNEKAFDLKLREEIWGDSKSVDITPDEYRLGLPVRQKPVKAGSVHVQPFSEQLIRVSSTAMEMRGTRQGIKVKPVKEGRFKDVIRLKETIAPTLIDSAKKSPKTYLKGVQGEKILQRYKDAWETKPVKTSSLKQNVELRKTGVKLPLTKKDLSRSGSTPSRVLEGGINNRQAGGGKLVPQKSGRNSYYGSEEAYYKFFGKNKPGRLVGAYPYPAGRKKTDYSKSIISSYKVDRPVGSSIYSTPQKSDYKSTYTPNYNPDYTPNYNPSYTPNYNPSYTPKYQPDYKPDYYPEYSPSYKPTYTPDYKIQVNPKTTPTTLPKVMRKVPKKYRLLGAYKKKSKEKVDGFDVYVKKHQHKKGKGWYESKGYSKVNKKPLTREQAFKVGARTVDKFTQRSFTLKKAKKKVEKGVADSDFFGTLKQKFRHKKGNKNVYVEKTAHAIDSWEEKLGIPYESQRLAKAGITPYKKKRRRRKKK